VMTTVQKSDVVGISHVAMYRNPALVTAAGLVCAAAALILFAWLAEEVLEGEMRRFDLRAHTVIYQPNLLPHLTAFMERVTALGSGEFLVPLALGLVLAFLIARCPQPAFLFFITLSGAGLLEWLLKICFKIPRPTTFHVIALPTSYSFPSGHALASFSFYGLLASIVIKRLSNHIARALTWFAAALLVVLIGISRIYLGVHNASDVFAGYAAALVWTTAVMIANRLWATTRANEKLNKTEATGPPSRVPI